jgi:hypothetical protein
MGDRLHQLTCACDTQRRRSRVVGLVVSAVFVTSVLAACSPSDVPSEAGAAKPTEVSAEVLKAVATEPSTGDAPFRFVDVAEAAGLSAPQAEIREGLPVNMAAGAAAVDYDEDGFVDLYLTRRGLPNRLMRNNGDGTFSDVATAAGVEAPGADGTPVFADVDGDGDLDLFVTGIGEAGQNQLYINDGSGRFTDEAEVRGVTIDLMGARGEAMAMQFGAAFADVDRDGDLDLVVTQWFPGDSTTLSPRSRFLRNDGSGFFSDDTEAAGLDGIKMSAGFTPAFHDVDGDGWQDLLVVGDWGTSRVYRNRDGKRFEDVSVAWGIGVERNGMGPAIADLDNDGRIEWFVTSINYPNPLRPLVKDGEESFEGIGCPNGVDQIRSGSWGKEAICTGNALYAWEGTKFRDVTERFGVRNGFWGWGATAADFDLDGRPELAMTNGMDLLPERNALNTDDPLEEYAAAFRTDPNRLWRFDGPGAWKNVAAATGFANTDDGKALLAFDFDRDGDLDVLQANTVSPPILYRTDTEPGRRWVRVKLVEPGGLRGAGATIEVTPEGGRTQKRTVLVGGTYMGQEPYEQTFGLGDAMKAGVAVVWSDGVRQKVGAVEIDRQITVAKKN